MTLLWNKPGVAESIDKYWVESVDEVNYRKLLAKHVIQEIDRGKILEVGCGSGLVYKALKEETELLKYVGIDISHSMLKLAKDRFPDVRFELGNINKIKVKDNSFNVVICFEVLGHLKDIVVPIKELIRVTKKVCMFTLWICGGSVPIFYNDRYEYPDSMIREIIGDYKIEIVNFPWTRMYKVYK